VVHSTLRGDKRAYQLACLKQVYRSLAPRVWPQLFGHPPLYGFPSTKIIVTPQTTTATFQYLANHDYRLRHARLLKRRLHPLVNPLAPFCVRPIPQTLRATASTITAHRPTSPSRLYPAGLHPLCCSRVLLYSSPPKATIDPKLAIASLAPIASPSSPRIVGIHRYRCGCFRQSRFETSEHHRCRKANHHDEGAHALTPFDSRRPYIQSCAAQEWHCNNGTKTVYPHSS